MVKHDFLNLKNRNEDKEGLTKTLRKGKETWSRWLNAVMGVCMGTCKPSSLHGEGVAANRAVDNRVVEGVN